MRDAKGLPNAVREGPRASRSPRMAGGRGSIGGDGRLSIVVGRRPRQPHHPSLSSSASSCPRPLRSRLHQPFHDHSYLLPQLNLDLSYCINRVVAAAALLVVLLFVCIIFALFVVIIIGNVVLCTDFFYKMLLITIFISIIIITPRGIGSSSS